MVKTSHGLWSVEKDAVVPEHHHPHEQIMHVVSGEFEFTLKERLKYIMKEMLYIYHLIPHTQEKQLPHVP